MSNNSVPELTLQDIAHHLDAKGPGHSGWYNAKCPAHDDRTASLGIRQGNDGGIAMKCHAGCKYKEIAAEIERQTGKKMPGKRGKKKDKALDVPAGVTLEAYREYTKLPGAYLQGLWRCVEVIHNGSPALTFPYFDEHFKFIGMKYRIRLDGGNKFVWDTGKYPKTDSAPYGLAQLLDLKANWKGNIGEVIVIAEGESDTQTLIWNGIPALGISGAKSWEPEFAKIPLIRDAKYLLVIQEPPKVGATEDVGADFVNAIRSSFTSQPGKVVAVKFNWPLKDPSAVWKSEPCYQAFIKSWEKLLSEAADSIIPFTHSGNAERMVAKYGSDFRWLQDADEFRTWNGEVWEPSRGGDGKLLALTKEVARSIANKKWALASESQSHRLAMIRLSKGEHKVFSNRDEFDQKPMLLNVRNGTVDLEIQELRQFQRGDFLTYKSPVSFDPYADCPQFDEFMNFTFASDADLIHFMDKAMGYSLTGDASEQCLFMCNGPGANGKSVLLQLLENLLGPHFAVAAKLETFIETRGFNNTEYEFTSFAGKRLVTTIEPKASGRFNEELLKRVTGGDLLKARPIYGHPFSFRPTFKLWMAMNTQPRITGTDAGIWRRVRNIPFTQTVPEARRIKDFAQKMLREEGSGILNRLLRGIGAWMEEGLKPPTIVEQATAAYRAQQDTFGRFVTDRCVVHPNAKVQCGTLYESYKTWAEGQKEHVLTAVAISRELDSRNFEKTPVAAGIQHRLGIGLQADGA
jgi:putative DNA primase/helicase